ncbi:MAG: tetratricopeptide repeat protein [Smithellaceae bacterium]
MSYINDALRKAQKENKTDSGRLGKFFSASPKQTRTHSGWYSAAGILSVFLFAVAMIALMYWPRETQSRPASLPEVGATVAAQETTTDAPSDAPLPETVDVEPVTQAIPPAVETAVSPPVAAQSGGKKPPVRPDSKAPKRQPAPAKTPAALYAQALQHQNEGRLDRAEALYQQVLKADPRHLAAINNLGVVYMRQKKFKQAIARFDEALHLRQNYVKAHYNLACVYAQKNDLDRSLFYLQSALDIHPDVRQWLKGDPDLKNLTDSPEFTKMIQERYN